MNRKRIYHSLIFIFTTAILVFFGGHKVLAITDKIEINCNSGDQGPNNCDVSPSNTAPLFNEADFPLFDLKPGDEIHRQIIVHNNREEICYFALTDAENVSDTETPPGSGNYFSDRLKTEISDGINGTGLISFADLFDLSNYYLATLNPGQSKTLDWDVYFDANAGNEYQNARLQFNFTWNFNCGEEQPQPLLFIEKTNNKIGIVQQPGADVTYTLTIKTSDLPVYNVTVFDLPPGGFTYRTGTWTASSTETRDPSNPIFLDHAYGSPGSWDLGDMKANETVTLTYLTDINNNQQPGTYKDIAWTQGTAGSDPISSRVLGNEDTGFFVGTSAIVDLQNPPEVQVEPEINVVKKEEGEVLGASTLPATGSYNFLLFLVVNFFGIGLIALLLGLYLKRSALKKASLDKKSLTSLAVFLLSGLIFVATARAAGPNVLIRMEDPKDPNNLNSVNLNFVTMDTENRPITVKCFKKGPGDAAFTQFGSDIVTIPGGDDGYCHVSSSILFGMGQYKFYTTAQAGSDPVEYSQTITIEHDDQSPGKPHDLKKDKNGSCKYDISFTTDNDGGDTVRVEVYRSDEKQFYANSSTRIRDINVGSDTDVDFTDNRPTCGKTYYYAVIAFDAAGNRSKPLVEELEKEEIVIISTKETQQGTAGGEEVIAAIPSGQSSSVGGEGEQQGEPEVSQQEPEEVLGAQEKAKEEAGTPSLLSRLFDLLKWPLLVLLVFLIFLYARKKLSQRNSEQNNSQL